MARKTPFSVGQRWYCDNSATGRPSFTFVILGTDMLTRPNEKLCRLEYDDPSDICHGIVQPYSHKHLKKYAKLVVGQ
jgi:hypothetical protein